MVLLIDGNPYGKDIEVERRFEPHSLLARRHPIRP
jgi:hypothetical protein